MTQLSRDRTVRKATISDVALQAGVSIKTVSRVANKEANVRAKTRVHVQRVIDELQYRPDPSARSLSSRKSFLVGLVYDNPSGSYLINVQHGSLETIRANGYDLVMYPCEYQNKKLPDELLALVRQSRVDGLVLTPPLSDMASITDMLNDTGTPFVSIAPADQASHHCVYTNDRRACAEVTRYLAELGHRDIGFIIGHPDHRAVGNRFEGYKDGLGEVGIALRPELIQQGLNSFSSGVDCAQRLLSGDAPPTAIFASNDDMAAGVLKVAHERGLSVPRDLSVVGFDDIRLASQVWPSLTTVRQPIEAMGRRATELLLRRLADQPADDLELMIESTLIVRESTGPAGR
ncbi:MAG: LacI family DNA-binding transcriptional regulator [Pseudomonadota bacterium]